jgi:hypothetical protein
MLIAHVLIIVTKVIRNNPAGGNIRPKEGGRRRPLLSLVYAACPSIFHVDLIHRLVSRNVYEPWHTSSRPCRAISVLIVLSDFTQSHPFTIPFILNGFIVIFFSQ